MINDLIKYKKENLNFYDPLSFFRIKEEKSYKYYVQNDLNDDSNNQFKVNISGDAFVFIYAALKWDTDFFKQPVIKLKYILYDSSNFEDLLKAIDKFKTNFLPKTYIFIEIPPEDNILIQALNTARFKLVETRMTYFLDLKKYENERFKTRSATLDDINNLKKVSSEMVNPYDRFHSDISINNKLADDFLGVFAEQSIKGFADYVMVPAESGVASDSFLTAKYMTDIWDTLGLKVSKMVLSAVSSATNKGWYIKLISEMAYHLKDKGAEFAIMHPAATNKAVIHTYEKLGCKLGKVTHILSYEV